MQKNKVINNAYKNILNGSSTANNSSCNSNKKAQNHFQFTSKYFYKIE